jgi:diguanylate cyclase (GGDEF)-like protein/PAS domain S-box-containing protein
LDPEGNVIDVNPGLTKITGYSRADMQGQPFARFGEGLNEQALYASLRESVMTTGYWRGEIVNRHKSGAISKDMLTMTAVRDGDGKISEVIVVMNSIEKMLIDSVTGLPNRILFEERMTQQLEDATTNGVKLALLEIGVHGVGAVNHTFGYKIGDLLLHEIGERIASYAGAGRKIGRVGDTTFALVLENDEGDKALETFAQKILAGLSEPFFIDDVSVLVNAAIGVAQFPQDSNTVEELRSHAGQAYKLTADSGESAVTFFSPSMETGAKVRTYLTSDLQDALRDKKIEFYYQPIVRVADRLIVKAEVLARWNDEHLGTVSPARFIPLAEESGLIHELGHQLFESALDTALELQQLGRPIQLGLNVSPVEIMAPSFARMEQMTSKMKDGLDPQNIVFELTEGILLNRKDIIEERIRSCRMQGVRFAIDDFGTGYSSLAYLQQLEVDFIKIDKSFIDKIENEEGFALCRSIVELAHALGLEVIAEGVETETQLGLLDHLGCEYAQGYLFSPAVPRAAFLEFLGFKQS